jgi:isopenicillin N synthase-like dioxygenase
MHDMANDVVADTSANGCRHGIDSADCNADAGTDDEAEGDAIFAALAEHGYFRVALTPDEWRSFDAAHAATHAFFAENSAEERKKWVQVCSIPFRV